MWRLLLCCYALLALPYIYLSFLMFHTSCQVGDIRAALDDATDGGGACKLYVGQPVACKGQGRKLLDLHGHVLGTVSLPGGARDIRHREIQLTMVSDLNYNVGIV